MAKANLQAAMVLLQLSRQAAMVQHPLQVVMALPQPQAATVPHHHQAVATVLLRRPVATVPLLRPVAMVLLLRPVAMVLHLQNQVATVLRLQNQVAMVLLRHQAVMARLQDGKRIVDYGGH
jgi:hypothetical protein